MSGYSDAILAEPSLVHLWPLRNGQPAKGSTSLTIGSAVGLLHLGRAGDDPAMRFERLLQPNSYALMTPPSFTGAHTVEMLIRIGVHSASGIPHIFATPGLGNGHQHTELYLRRLQDVPGQPAMGFRISNGTNAYLSPFFGDVDVWTAGFHHAVLAVGADGSWEFFIDGTSFGTGTWGALGGTPVLFTSPYTTYIASSDGNFTSSSAFDGWIQHVAVYNTKLSLVEVQAHYAALGSVPTMVYRAPAYAAPLYSRIYDFRVATVTKSLPRTLAVAAGGTSRASRMEPPGGFGFPSGMTMIPPSPLIGGISRPGRMVGAPPGGFTAPVPMTAKLITLGSKPVARPVTGQVWPR